MGGKGIAGLDLWEVEAWGRNLTAHIVIPNCRSIVVSFTLYLNYLDEVRWNREEVNVVSYKELKVRALNKNGSRLLHKRLAIK